MNADGCTMGFRCVQCGFPIDMLYIQYSPGNIRLMKCEYCKAIADGYIECEVMILIIDLILHKPKAYRHLVYNRFSKQTVNFKGLFWKSISAFLILDIYRMWVLRMNENEWTLPVTVVSFLLDFGKVERGVAYSHHFKLLQDPSHGHDGMEVPILCDFHHRYVCHIIKLCGFKSDHRLNDGEMLDSLPRGSWFKVFILSRTYRSVLNLTNKLMLLWQQDAAVWSSTMPCGRNKQIACLLHLKLTAIAS